MLTASIFEREIWRDSFFFMKPTGLQCHAVTCSQTETKTDLSQLILFINVLMNNAYQQRRVLMMKPLVVDSVTQYAVDYYSAIKDLLFSFIRCKANPGTN